MIEVPRNVDEEARSEFIYDPEIASLAAALVGLEHITHHGQPLRYTGSTIMGGYSKYRFACAEPSCSLKLIWEVAEDCGHPIAEITGDGTCGKCGAEL